MIIESSAIQFYVNVITVSKAKLGDAKLIISISGLSLSGKTTFIKILEKRLLKKALSCITIPLDYWILPIKKRNSFMTVRERYQYEKIYEDLSLLLQDEAISIFPYVPLTRTISKKKIAISISDFNVVFIDGTIALDHSYIRRISNIKIHCEINEKLREKRFVDFYLKKGLFEDEIQLLYKKRTLDETPIVMLSKNEADYLFYGDKLT